VFQHRATLKRVAFLLILRGENSGAAPEGHAANARFSARKNFGPFFGLDVSKLPLVA
jgi:hypothetical protein